MNAELNRAERLAGMAIDAEARSTLAALRPLVATHIDGAIDAAFRWLLQFPEVQKIYASIDIAEAKKAQRQHWLDDIFSGEFGDEQFQRAMQIGKKRHQAGLGLRWYFVFWMVMFKELSKAIATDRRKARPEQVARELGALSKAILFDLELFTAVWVQAAENAAAADLNRHASQFEAEVSETVRMVAASIVGLQANAQSMSTMAERTASEAHAAMAAGSEASSNAQGVAAATEELSASIQEIARHVAASTEVTGSAVGEAHRANALVQGLVEAASRIGDVIQLIKGVAAQTNLLALNATIEAARAGAAGKGFAVVASEVKGLANQTAKATDEISAQIVAVQKATENAVQAISAIGATIGKVSTIAANIAAAIEQQRVATQGIAQNIQDVALSSGTANNSVGAVNEMAEQTGQSARKVLTDVSELGRQSDKLGARVESFLQAVRRAT